MSTPPAIPIIPDGWETYVIQFNSGGPDPAPGQAEVAAPNLATALCIAVAVVTQHNYPAKQVLVAEKPKSLIVPGRFGGRN